MSRNKFVEYERGEIIGSTSIDKRDSEKARKWNKAIDSKLQKQRNEWQLIPPSNMTIILHKDAGAVPAGLVLSMPHEIGRVILHKRLGKILQHDVNIDAVIDGGLEEACIAMGLSPTEVAA